MNTITRDEISNRIFMCRARLMLAEKAYEEAQMKTQKFLRLMEASCWGVALVAACFLTYAWVLNSL